MEHIEIPTQLFWENGNSWYGSLGNARFFIKPERPEGADGLQLSIQFWRGPLAMNLSEITATASFPVTQEGLAQAAAWLEEQAAEVNP